MWPFKKKEKRQSSVQNRRYDPPQSLNDPLSITNPSSPLWIGHYDSSSSRHDACPHDNNPHSSHCDHSSSYGGSSYDSGSSGSSD